jgi:ABC-type transport system involved in multi-copper enzyme maturation permease subunit
MVGPVFFLELLLGSRRGRLPTFRRIFAGWLVLQFALLFLILFDYERHRRPADPGMGPVINIALQVLLAQHFLLVLLATPAFVAGAITDEKVQGTLQHLLTADLLPREIVMGKFLGRMAQVALLALVAWPLICFLGGYGQFGLAPLLCTLVVTLVVFFSVGSVSMWASVRSKQTREAVLRVYVLFTVVGLAVWGVLEAIDAVIWKFPVKSPMHLTLMQVDDLLRCLNPLHVLDAVWGQDDLWEFARRLRVMLLVFGGLGVGCLLLAVLLFRPLYLRQIEAPFLARRTRRRRTRVPDDYDPIRWRERTVGRRLTRWVWMALLVALTVASAWWIIKEDEPTYFAFQGVVALFLLSLVAGIRASGSISGERERRTWESLLLTPLDTWDLIYDKLHGTRDALFPYFVAYAVPALIASYWGGVGAMIITAALVALTYIAIYYMAATGVTCSARSRSSWRSLISTVVTGFAYWLAALMGLGFVYLWLGVTLGPLVEFILRLGGIVKFDFPLEVAGCVTTCVAVAFFLWRSSDKRIAYAKVCVDDNERYGRTFTRSLERALIKHYERLEQRRRTPPAEPARIATDSSE